MSSDYPDDYSVTAFRTDVDRAIYCVEVMLAYSERADRAVEGGAPCDCSNADR